jgi:hypothetical protein
MAETDTIEPKKSIEFEKTEVEGWEFYRSSLPMMNTKELDQIGDVIPTHTLPDIVFGYNRFYFVNKKRNFLYEFSPIDSLSLTAFAVQNKRIHPDELEETKDVPMDDESPELLDDDEHSRLNRIDLKPARVEVSMAAKWKDRDTSNIDDYKEIEIISDWTYSTPYKGTILYLDKNVDRIKNEFNLQIDLEPTPEHSEIKIERCEDEIPVHRLTPENPIVHYME